jgi:SagB-type dehydrogenase family enzyme
VLTQAATLVRFAERFAHYGFDAKALMPVYGLAENGVGLAFPPLGRGPRIDTVDRRALHASGRAEPVPAERAGAMRVACCGLPLPGRVERAQVACVAAHSCWRFDSPRAPMSTIPLDLEAGDVVLPPPSLPARMTLDQALKARRSTREFFTDALPLATVSALLWGAFGINRPDSGGRTAPSAHDWQEIDVYVVLAEGSYRYDARAHRLMLVKAEDLRALTGTQDFPATAPLNLVYVADFARMTNVRADEREFLAGADAGFIAQNVYLACASLGLGTVVRGLVDRRILARALGLSATQRITLAQTVGLPRSLQ